MKRSILLFFCLAFGAMSLSSQTSIEVYNILQAKCASCHSSASPQGGLDLSGSPADVYAALYDVTPTNTHAQAEGKKLIYPGRTDLSFLFEKINDGLEPTVSLHTNSLDQMPPAGSPDLTDKERELIRQWIVYGAPTSGTVVDQQLISDYYDMYGRVSTAFPSGPPAAPDPSEGFQIKMGPYLIEPGGEVEYWQKYELDLPANTEVTRLDNFISTYSHHFILYRYESNATAASMPHGLRTSQNHNNITLVEAIQEAQDLRLPEGTAFKWNSDAVLDLNTHYINYDAVNPYMAEVYFNVYTQPDGTAAQEMQTDLLANPAIYIPNNGNEYTFTDQETASGDIYLWGLMGHTHQWGTDFKVYENNSPGNPGTLIYDASCQLGVPGCASPYYDYQHIPMRYWDDFLEIDMTKGFTYEASYVNNGPNATFFGFTSDDEMMVLVAMYLLDTTGVTTAANPAPEYGAVGLFPNPADDVLYLDLPFGIQEFDVSIYSMTGQLMQREQMVSTIQNGLDISQLPTGIYVIDVVTDDGRRLTNKIMVE